MWFVVSSPLQPLRELDVLRPVFFRMIKTLFFITKIHSWKRRKINPSIESPKRLNDQIFFSSNTYRKLGLGKKHPISWVGTLRVYQLLIFLCGEGSITLKQKIIHNFPFGVRFIDLDTKQVVVFLTRRHRKASSRQWLRQWRIVWLKGK